MSEDRMDFGERASEIKARIASNVDNGDSRYYYCDLNFEDHRPDLITSLDAGDLRCIVDEEDGGIIAYALGEDHAERIIAALKAQA